MLTHLKKSALLGLSVLTFLAALAIFINKPAPRIAEQAPSQMLLAEDDYRSGGG